MYYVGENQSDVQNLIYWTSNLTGVSNLSNLMIILSTIFIFVCAVYGFKSGMYEGIAAGLIGLLTCSLLLFMPPMVFSIVIVVLSLILAGRIMGMI